MPGVGKGTECLPVSVLWDSQAFFVYPFIYVNLFISDGRRGGRVYL